MQVIYSICHKEHKYKNIVNIKQTDNSINIFNTFLIAFKKKSTDLAFSSLSLSESKRKAHISD